MRPTVLWVLVFGLAASAYAVTPSTGNRFQLAPKPAAQPYENPGIRVQGDTVADPFIIGSLPFSASGETCGFNNDYDAACPYTGSTSPDVVYRWTAVAPIAAFRVDLCASIYDTKVYVYEDAVDTPIACNDDFCSWQSFLDTVPVTTGHDYFIVVDGYGGSCGTYVLDVTEYTPCIIECPAGAMPEGEPDCYDGYEDDYNGGCNWVPYPIFQEIAPACDPIVICGTTGVFVFGSFLYRDSDWFELNLTEPANICLAGDAEVPCYFFILDGRWGCAGGWTEAEAIPGPCLPTDEPCCSYCDFGTWWMWVGPRNWDPGNPCGSAYWMEITGYVGGSSPANETTWGSIKNLFK
jgi:hypothetical protein